MIVSDEYQIYLWSKVSSAKERELKTANISITEMMCLEKQTGIKSI